MTWNTTPLVFRNGVSPTWIADDHFWYRVTTPAGTKRFSSTPRPAPKSRAHFPRAHRARRRALEAEGVDGAGAARRRSSRRLSPDGKRAVFIRDWNLWVRDNATGRKRALTTDGVKDFGYATDNAGWAKSDRPIVVWSPDSQKIATFQQDQRNVGEMYLVSTAVGHPQLQTLEISAARRRHGRR